MTDCIPQLVFSFYRHQPIHADFSGGQITSDAGLLPLRPFDQRHQLTRDLAETLSDPRQDDHVRHDSLALLRQRLYQIVAGYEDAIEYAELTPANHLRHSKFVALREDKKAKEVTLERPVANRKG